MENQKDLIETAITTDDYFKARDALDEINPEGLVEVALNTKISNHAITFGEFKYILDVYNEYGEGEILDKIVEDVYKKYEGKEIFTFHSERFDLEKEEVCLEPNPRKKYINMHRDLIKDEY